MPEPRPNPLSAFSSYTYKISLYMVTPEAYSMFLTNDRRGLFDIPGVFVVAQSGGVNSSVQTRAEGFEFDYYIDDLKISSAISGKSTQTQSNSYKMSFNIIEPMGFSFISNLKKASEKVKNTSKLPNIKAIGNAAKQFFVIGIQFLGYDNNGKVMVPSDFGLSDSEIYGIYYDITLTSIKFKLDGKAVTYAITAQPCMNEAYGKALGTTAQVLTIDASDVESAIGGGGSTGMDPPNGLLSLMNFQQQQRVQPKQERQQYPNKYIINWPKNVPGVDLIKAASMVDPNIQTKSKSPTSNTENSKQSTHQKSEKTSTEFSVRAITIQGGTSVMKAIELIIKQSTYLSNALKTLEKGDLNPAEGKPNKVVNSQHAPLAWYNLSAKVLPLDWDIYLNNFCYEIIYTIVPYQVPALRGSYVDSKIKYYGPHKRYEYWFTGQNSEITKYEQQLDNAFFVVALNPEPSDDGATTKQVNTSPADASKVGTTATQSEAVNSVVTSLNDPGSTCQCKISILGDPEFLMNEPTYGSVNDVYNQFYGSNSFTINPNSGQVFIEIDFKEPVDYNHSTGVMDMNSSVLLWDYPPAMKELVKGLIVYQVNTVDSSFSKGMFTQELTCVTPSFDGANSTVAPADPSHTDFRKTEAAYRQEQNAIAAEQAIADDAAGRELSVASGFG